MSNVTNMSHMFYNALSFDRDVSGWDVYRMTMMIDTFTMATSLQ